MDEQVRIQTTVKIHGKKLKIMVLKKEKRRKSYFDFEVSEQCFSLSEIKRYNFVIMGNNNEFN
ncbi:MAG: hypothetical protein LBR15_08280 [Methanobrevibacter sp.]|jgi:hypothetical protein|nr:hypothetical protein [Candidatus Methanovirga australis]